MLRQKDKQGMNLYSQKPGIDLLELFTKVWASRMLILRLCIIGAIVGIVVVLGIPKEYTAEVLMTPERTTRSSSSNMSALIDMADVDIKSSSITGKDAIYPSLYPIVVKSTPFIIPLFDIKVCEQKDSTSMTLARYLRERQKKPWWNTITSAPFRLMGWTMSLFTEKPKVNKVKSRIDPFRLTREEAGMIGAIASKIKIEIEKQKRTITILVTMQDPLVAAIVADTVRMHLQEYITDYRTNKARRILKYNEELCKEAQTAYYTAQDEYTRYADANRNLAMLTSRAELARLQHEMNLAYTTYNQAELQVQASKARVEKVTPLYAVIQPALVPLAPSKPHKGLIVMMCILLSAAGSIGWILFMKDFIEKIKKRIILPVGK